MSRGNPGWNWRDGLIVCREKMKNVSTRKPAMPRPIAVKVRVPKSAYLAQGLDRVYLDVGSLRMRNANEHFFVKRNVVGRENLLELCGKEFFAMGMVYAIKRGGKPLCSVIEFDVSLPVNGDVHRVIFLSQNRLREVSGIKKITTVPVPNARGGNVVFIPTTPHSFA